MAGLLASALTGCVPAEQEPVESALPYFDSADFTPRWLDEVPDDFHAVEAFSLLDQHGATITETDLLGNVGVVDFFFTSCSGICPRLTRNMGVVDAAFDADAALVLLSHSVTPTEDTVEVLTHFAELKGVESERWHLLTGDRDLIYHLGREVYFVEEDEGLDKSPDDFLHTENMVLVDQDGHLRGVYNGLNDASVAQLIDDAAWLLER